MKVFQINSVYKTGSTGKIAYDIKKYLESRGDSSVVAYARGNYTDDGAIKIQNKFDMYLHIFLSRITDRQGFYSKGTTKKLIKAIIEYEPDIIHLHNIHGYYLNIPMLFKFLKEFGKPVVWTLHDCWAFTGHCAYFDYANCDKWKTCCNNCPCKKSYPASNLLDNSSQNYSIKKELFNGIENLTLVTPSDWLNSVVKKSFIGKNTVTTINNGIDTTVFKPIKSDILQKYGIENKRVYLGVANIWEKRKGLDDFLALSDMLSEDEVIFLVGLSEKQIKLLKPNMVGITRTENATELAKLYSAASCFLNPTYEDNYPTTNLEALACGTPVVTYNTGGSGEAVKAGMGAVVNKGEIKAMLENARKDYSSNDILNHTKELDKEFCYNNYIELYKVVAK